MKPLLPHRLRPLAGLEEQAGLGRVSLQRHERKKVWTAITADPNKGKRTVANETREAAARTRGAATSRTLQDAIGLDEVAQEIGADAEWVSPQLASPCKPCAS